METVLASNENTPLLENGGISNEYGQHNDRFEPITLEKPLEESQSPSNKRDSDLNAENLVLSVPEDDGQENNEVSKEEVAQALCAAYGRGWEHLYEITSDIFTEKELYRMHLAWKKVTKGKLSSSESYKMAAPVAEAIAKERNDRSESPTSISPYADRIEIVYLTEKELLTANLLRKWKMITEGDSFPLRYKRTILDDSDEAIPAVSDFLIRLVDLYDKIHDFIFNSTFQFIMFSLLLIWPLSILVVGAKYMGCPMSHYLSYLIMMLGCIGCLAVLIRLFLIHAMSHRRNRDPTYYLAQRNGLKFIEFGFLIVFIVQAIHLFNTDPVTEPDPEKCVESFYNAGLWINYVSLVFISAFVFVYFIKICLNLFDVSYWIFKVLENF